MKNGDAGIFPVYYSLKEKGLSILLRLLSILTRRVLIFLRTNTNDKNLNAAKPPEQSKGLGGNIVLLSTLATSMTIYSSPCQHLTVVVVVVLFTLTDRASTIYMLLLLFSSH